MGEKPRCILGMPTVMKYILDDKIFIDLKMNPIIFDVPSIEWLNFVRDNRRRGEPENRLRHNHGVVRGPIANDKVNFIVEDYLNNKITAEEAITRVKTLPNVLQVSLHTQNALLYLNTSDILYQKQLPNDKWSEWINLFI